MTIVKFKKSKLRFNLIFGLIWLIYGTISIFFDSTDYYKYGFICIGLIYLVNFLFQNHYQYASITSNVIKKYTFPRKEIAITDIRDIRDFAGDYKFISKNKTLTIEKGLIDPYSLKEIELFISKFKI